MDIKFIAEDRNGERRELESPDDMGLSLMEVLKAYEYNILATCGGMALCATCHVKVLEGLENLPGMNDAEADMLDTLPDAASNSRLACQLRISEALSGGVFQICGEEEEYQVMGPDPEILMKVVTEKMPFGKYKDVLICDLPVHYLEWFHSKGFPKGNLGMWLHTIYEIKINGLEQLLVPLKKGR